MNKMKSNNTEHLSAKEIWALGQKLGVTFSGDEIEIIQRIRDMVLRDKQLWQSAERKSIGNCG
ncbi:hypothetical protein Ancab_013164, partial [Ancistrocladus abbreviatus]